jgi:2-polyprenyl-6-methoxyphenol hydroxylase-like FAD-dependent oxidoreductase
VKVSHIVTTDERSRTTTDMSSCLGFNQSGSRDKLMRSFEHMSQAARKITSFADADVKVWVLYDMQSMPSWTRGRLVLVGDAAHPSLPCRMQSSPKLFHSRN